MRVALDATPLTLSNGGLRRYTAELSLALAEEFPADEFLLASDRKFPMPPRALPNLTAAPGPRNAFERRWWSWGLNRMLARERIDVYHGTNFEVPYRPLRPSVLTLHDLSGWKGYPCSWRVRMRTPLLLRLGIATMVITPTEAVRREAIARFRLRPERVVAVPEAASPALQRVETRPGSPYFLCLGAGGPRKNVETVVEAWREVRKRHAVDLVLVGDFPAGPDIRVLGPVDDARLAELYSGALAFLYPSLYEGFGLPAIEAMQCGAAVFTSKDPAIAEVCGEAALRIDARDTRAWAEALAAACERPEWLQDLRARSLGRARDFSRGATARRTREVYQEARRRFAA
ncbi:MAG: glycosyltransferase family 1 protein [Bryobacteraceae bacterium]|jgi:alpha-1,3-rhamnosyl/mannosyltransferase